MSRTDGPWFDESISEASPGKNELDKKSKTKERETQLNFKEKERKKRKRKRGNTALLKWLNESKEMSGASE